MPIMASFLSVRECGGVVDVLGENATLGKALLTVVGDNGNSAEVLHADSATLHRVRG
jgi:hypothetical protein